MTILVTGAAGFIGFHLCKKLIELAENELEFSEKSRQLINQFFQDSFWLRLSDESLVPESLIKYHYVKNDNICSKLMLKCQEVRHAHQVPYWSLKFWYLLISNAFQILKKFAFRYLN